MARQGYLSLRLSNQERELYQELADRKGVTLADWIRSGLAIVAYTEGKREAAAKAEATAVDVSMKA